MRRIWPALIFAFFSVSILFVGGSFFFKGYLKKNALRDRSQKILLQTEYEIQDYCALGFSQESKLIQLLQERKKRVLVALDYLNSSTGFITGFLVRASHPTPDRRLIAVNKKMLSSYLRDLLDYRRLGLVTENAIMRFTYDKIIRLTIALAEFERQLQTNGNEYKTDYMQKVVRMLFITQQSITHCKRELRGCYEQGLSEHGANAQQVTKRLTRHVKIRNDLERIVYG